MGHKLVVGALFQDLAVLQHHDLVCVADGAQSVGDNDGRPTVKHLGHGLLDNALTVAIDVCRRFVEDQDSGVSDQRAGKADELSLSNAEVLTTLLKWRVIPLGHLLNEIVCANGLCRCNHIVVGRAGLVIGDVLTDAAGEEERFLKYHGGLASQRGLCHIADVVSVYGDSTLSDIVETVQQGHKGRLACAGPPHECHRLTWLYGQVNSLHHFNPWNVVEVDAFKGDCALYRWEVDGVLFVLDLYGRVQQPEDADTGGHGSLELGVLHGQVPDGIEEALDVEDEGYDDAHFHGAVDGLTPAEYHDEADSHGSQYLHHRHQRCGKSTGMEVGFQVPGIDLIKPLHVRLFAVQ